MCGEGLSGRANKRKELFCGFPKRPKKNQVQISLKKLSQQMCTSDDIKIYQRSSKLLNSLHFEQKGRAGCVHLIMIHQHLIMFKCDKACTLHV